VGTSYDRAVEVIAKLAALGVRATTDPSAVNPPVVLLTPPDRTYDLGCGYSARWQLAALAPSAQGADRGTWLELDRMADAVAEVVDVRDAQCLAYTVNGVTYAAFLITAEEEI
jgi:hypothetical protein